VLKIDLKNPTRVGKNVRKPQGGSIFWLTLYMFSDQYVFRTSGSTHYRCHHIHPSYCHPAFSWQWLCQNIGTELLQSIWYCSSPHPDGWNIRTNTPQGPFTVRY